MKRRDLMQLALLTASTAAVANLSGSGSGGDSRSSPVGGVRYEAPPEDLSDRVRFGDVAAQWGLHQPSSGRPGADWNAHRTYWYARCDVVLQADDARFLTSFGNFRLRGSVTLRVHHDVPAAVEEHARNVHRYVERQKDVRSTDVTGWWDAGVVGTVRKQMIPYLSSPGEPGAASLRSRLLVRHGNLVATSYAQAETSFSGERQATGQLESIVTALLEETVRHLSVSR